MRVLISGATGFVGGRVAHRYVGRGDDVTAAVRTPSSELAEAGIAQLEGGLAAIDADALDGMDAIVHAAASVDPDLASARGVNRDGTARIVDAALAAGTPRLVHISTTSVYDRAGAGDNEITEHTPLVTDGGPAGAASSAGSTYAITKAEAEHEVARGVDAGLQAAVLRPPAVLGAGPTSNWGTRVPRRLLHGEALPIHPDTTFGWVHVEDLVDAVVATGAATDVFVANIVGGHVSFRDYLDAVAAFLPDAPAAHAPPGDARPWKGRYARDRAPTLLGILLDRRFDGAMDEIADSWRAGDPEDGQ